MSPQPNALPITQSSSQLCVDQYDRRGALTRLHPVAESGGCGLLRLAPMLNRRTGGSLMGGCAVLENQPSSQETVLYIIHVVLSRGH